MSEGKADKLNRSGQVNRNSQSWVKKQQSRVLGRTGCGWWQRQTLSRKRKVCVCDSLKNKKTFRKTESTGVFFLIYTILHTRDFGPLWGSQGAQVAIVIATRAMTVTLPVVDQEKEVGQWNGQLDPLPSGKQVGNARENHNSQGEKYLYHDPNDPLGRTNDLCHWGERKPK